MKLTYVVNKHAQIQNSGTLFEPNYVGSNVSSTVLLCHKAIVMKTECVNTLTIIEDSCKLLSAIAV